jgi:hypothetical protein
MKKFLLLAALLASAASAVAVGIVLPSGQTAEFTLPDKWTAAAVPGGAGAEIGKTVRYVPPGGANASVFLSFLPTSEELMSEATALKDMHETGCQRYVDGSVEGRITSREIRVDSGRGYYSSFTDKAMVNRPPQKEEYKTVTFATIYLGNSVLATVSILTDDLNGAEHAAGMRLMESLKVRKNGKK